MFMPRPYGPGLFFCLFAGFFPYQPPTKGQSSHGISEMSNRVTGGTRRLCPLRDVEIYAQLAYEFLSERLDFTGDMVHATNVGKITALNVQDEAPSGQDGWLAHVKVGLILVIIGFGDWESDDYDRIIDTYEEQGYVMEGQGVDWWDHASNGNFDVFVLRLEKAE